MRSRKQQMVSRSDAPRWRLIGLVCVAAGACLLSACGSSSKSSSSDSPAAAASSGSATTSTSGSSASGKGLTIGEILLNTGSYQIAHQAAMQAYAKSQGITLKTCNANGTDSGQQNCVDEMISSQVDGFIMQPQDPASATSVIEQAQGSNIPVVTWAVGPVPGAQVPFVALAEYPQSKQAGITAAKWVIKHFHQSPKVVEVSIPNNTNCTNRMGGFIAGVRSVDKSAPLVAQPDGQGLTLPSENAMANVIQSGRPFNIATACNGDSSMGVLDALRAAGRGQAVNKVPKTEYVFGIDGTSQQIQQLLSKTSPLMQVLGLNPVENSNVLLNTMVRYIHKQIPSTYRGNLYDTLLSPNCKQALAFLKNDYNTSVACGL
jgi:ABC-type sugar transport system substrate-binding protein